MRTVVSAPCLALAASLAMGSAAEAGPAFNQRFEGAWVGVGTVQRDSDPQPRRVTCRVDGAADATRLSISGTCRAMLIFTRAIGADLAVDGSGRYRGTYVGSRVGPARLSGALRGDRAVLDAAFPPGVGGGRQQMIIENRAGSNRFVLRVTDMIDGARREITNLVFERR
jgi:hypothetical protein